MLTYPTVASEDFAIDAWEAQIGITRLFKDQFPMAKIGDHGIDASIGTNIELGLGLFTTVEVDAVGFMKWPNRFTKHGVQRLGFLRPKLR